MQYEDPVMPGVRPSMPVSACSIVDQSRKRVFPERETSTGLPPPFLPKAPQGREWGGWGSHGEPGRGVLDRPWEVQKEGDPDAADLRIGDMRKKKFSDQRFPLTPHLTTWHWDPMADIDPVKQKRVHHSSAISSAAHASMRVNMPMAGKPYNIPAEGASLSFYDRVRTEDRAAGGSSFVKCGSMTAR